MNKECKNAPCGRGRSEGASLLAAQLVVVLPPITMEHHRGVRGGIGILLLRHTHTAAISK